MSPAAVYATDMDTKAPSAAPRLNGEIAILINVRSSNGARLRRTHTIMFERPVTLDQLARAIERLAAHFGPWMKGETIPDSERAAEIRAEAERMLRP